MFGSIKISITNAEFSPAKRVAKAQGKSELQPEFCEYVAHRLYNDILDYIDNQHYAKSGKWAPLSISYLKYKRKHHLSDKIWVATGHLKNSIYVRKSGGHTYTVGISPTKKYPGTTVKVIDVAKWMEYGTRRMPPRPLFRPITTMYRNNVSRYWDDFNKYCINKNGKVIKSRLRPKRGGH